MVNPLRFRIGSIIPCEVFGRIELHGMSKLDIGIVCVGYRRCNELIGDLEFGETDGLAILVDGLHVRDCREHVVETGRIEAVSDLGVVLVRAVLDDLDG